MMILFVFMIAGFALAKFKILPKGSASILAKLENWLFLPALVFQTFVQNFTISMLGVTWKLFVFSLALLAVIIPITIFVCKLLTKDAYVQKIYCYVLCFANFAFMGNAVVKAIFPNFFYQYVIFTLALWIPIYLWGVPALLVPSGDKKSAKDKLRSLINPMFLSMIVGLVIGLLSIDLPAPVDEFIGGAANCMSPLAMLLTGITISEINFKKIFRSARVYIISALRLLVYPLVLIAFFAFVPIHIPDVYMICAVCSVAMPFGLNSIVIPAAYDKDTSESSGLVLISHALSVITIPLIFMLLRTIL